MDLIRSFKALADANRLNILITLLNRDLCVGALAARLGISKPAASQHLRVLREAGLVRGEKRGYWTHYVVDKEALVQVARELGDLAASPDAHEPVCRSILDRVP